MLLYRLISLMYGRNIINCVLIHGNYASKKSFEFSNLLRAYFTCPHLIIIFKQRYISVSAIRRFFHLKLVKLSHSQKNVRYWEMSIRRGLTVQIYELGINLKNM